MEVLETRKLEIKSLKSFENVWPASSKIFSIIQVCTLPFSFLCTK